MAKRNILFWFDVEDCSIPQSDDAARIIAEILTELGIKATMKVVGQKARMLRSRLGYDVIDALGRHVIGYHSNYHGLRPQPAEYMGPLGWLDGIAEFEQREKNGIEELRRLWGQEPVCYGQPGSNWAPQVFPVLRKWNIPANVGYSSYVSLRAQPFWYGGVINTSRMLGRDRKGRDVCHHIGLNFELGKHGELDKHKKLFLDSYAALEDGGLISIMNHPCTLVLERWHSMDIKKQELTKAGYEHFRKFVSWVLCHEDVRTVTADYLPVLYQDGAIGRIFELDELLVLARSVGEEVNFREFKGMSLSGAEMFGMFACFLARYGLEGQVPKEETCRYFDGPAAKPEKHASGFLLEGSGMIESAAACMEFMMSNGRMPDAIKTREGYVAPGDYFSALARTVVNLIENRKMSEKVLIKHSSNAAEKHVSEEEAHKCWASPMMLPGFSAPMLLELARLQAWTLKPAILQASK